MTVINIVGNPEGTLGAGLVVGPNMHIVMDGITFDGGGIVAERGARVEVRNGGLRNVPGHGVLRDLGTKVSFWNAHVDDQKDPKFARQQLETFRDQYRIPSWIDDEDLLYVAAGLRSKKTKFQKETFLRKDPRARKVWKWLKDQQFVAWAALIVSLSALDSCQGQMSNVELGSEPQRSNASVDIDGDWSDGSLSFEEVFGANRS